MGIRAAREDEIALLDSIAFRAKAHWGYAPTQLEEWHESLRTPVGSTLSRPTLVYELDSNVVGFVQLDPAPSPWEVVSLWVLPEHMGNGIGRVLLRQALEAAAASGQTFVDVDSDPNALGFYLACGAVQVGAVPAPIAGAPDRVRPQLRVSTSGA